MTPRTHLALRAVGDGRLEFTRLPVAQPANGQVRIRVEACGICRLDAATVEGGFPGLVYPRIPGHEIVGRIEALGEGVLHHAIGERVAVGLLAERCGHCAACLRGDFGSCAGVLISGVSADGGYAETMIAHQNAIVTVPDGLNPVDAAPLLCSGVTISNALKASRARSGDVVAVSGMDAFGQLALQFARHMGLRTVVIDRRAGNARRAHIPSPTELRDILEFSVAKGIRPLVETTSLEEASTAYSRVMHTATRFCVIRGGAGLPYRM
jgi:propanol-preferring alcohol dehydrogenase